MKDRETARMRKYGESKTTRIMMATVPHVTSGLGLRKFQADGFLLTRVYQEYFLGGKGGCLRLTTLQLWNQGAETSWNPMGLYRSVIGLLLCILPLIENIQIRCVHTYTHFHHIKLLTCRNKSWWIDICIWSYTRCIISK